MRSADFGREVNGHGHRESPRDGDVRKSAIDYFAGSTLSEENDHGDDASPAQDEDECPQSFR
jgi:hypothetical protein